jgi:DNA/RNA endonuclease G (NUC1)
LEFKSADPVQHRRRKGGTVKKLTSHEIAQIETAAREITDRYHFQKNTRLENLKWTEDERAEFNSTFRKWHLSPDSGFMTAAGVDHLHVGKLDRGYGWRDDVRYENVYVSLAADYKAAVEKDRAKSHLRNNLARDHHINVLRACDE